MKKDKIKKNEEENCEDCPVCQLMKNGKGNNMEELLKAFKEVEEKGLGVVGFGDVDLSI